MPSDDVPALLSARVCVDVCRVMMSQATDGLVLSTLFPLLAGAIAGVIAVLASQPADVVLTRTNDDGATLGDAVASVREQPALILQGLSARMLYGVLLVSLQFLIYTNLRGLFGVSKADLTLVLDALAVLRR